MDHYGENSKRIQLSDLHGCAGNVINQKSGLIIDRKGTVVSEDSLYELKKDLFYLLWLKLF